MSNNPAFRQSDFLVKYGHPIQVSTSSKTHKGKKDDKSIANIDKNLTNAHTEDILNSILPPREYTMDKQQLWIQSVSATPATKADVIQLQEMLDQRLQERQSRETGICPIREELYAQCFDELIRQITINCAERGLLLVRVRDEMRMTIQSYQSLYESSIAYGMRIALQSEQRKSEMTNKAKQLESECSDLQRQVDTLEQKIKVTEENDQIQRENDEKSHKEAIESQRKANQRIKEELEKMLTGPIPKK